MGTSDTSKDLSRQNSGHVPGMKQINGPSILQYAIENHSQDKNRDQINKDLHNERDKADCLNCSNQSRLPNGSGFYFR